MGIEQGELIIEGLTLPLALRFISGKYQGGEFPLPDEGEIVIGRSSELDMVLVEDMVSRRHAKISVQDGDIFLEDLGSTNGSFVNGEKITRTKLADLFPEDGTGSQPRDLSLGAAREANERECILRMLESHGWRMAETANALGVSRKTLWQKMKRMDIQRP